MCDTCWRDAGSPKDWTPQTGQLLALIDDLYRIHPTGGPLHVVLDDWNLDGTITPYYDGCDPADLDALHYEGIPIADLDPAAPAVVEQLGISTRTLCDRIAGLLNDMTDAQRYAALAYHEGFVERPTGEAERQTA
jgi:hypothetical protein